MRGTAHGLLLMLLLAFCAAASGAERMSYPCYRAPVAPVMDGVIVSDPAWERVPAATGFSKLGDGYTDAKQTYVQACWDDQAFYVGVTCEEPDVARMELRVRDGGDTWLDDGVEIFLQPGGSRQVTQFVVTAGGARGGYEGAPNILRYQVAAHAGQDDYSLEIRVPFELLGVSPKPGDRWRGNFCRNIWTTESGGDKFTSWAPLTARFLEPEHFAAIEFLGSPPDPSRAAAIGDRLNRRYRADLSRRLKAAAASSPEYAPALAEASKHPRFRSSAMDLRRRWRQLERVQRQADSAPLPELRRILKGAASLSEESENLKYAYLTAVVLGD